MQEIWVQFLDWEAPLDEGMATHSSLLASQIPWTEEPGGLQSLGSQKSWAQLSNQTTIHIPTIHIKYTDTYTHSHMYMYAHKAIQYISTYMYIYTHIYAYIYTKQCVYLCSHTVFIYIYNVYMMHMTYMLHN